MSHCRALLACLICTGLAGCIIVALCSYRGKEEADASLTGIYMRTSAIGVVKVVGLSDDGKACFIEGSWRNDVFLGVWTSGPDGGVRVRLTHEVMKAGVHALDESIVLQGRQGERGTLILVVDGVPPLVFGRW